MDNWPSGFDKVILEVPFTRKLSSTAIFHHSLDESGCGGSLAVGGSDFINISLRDLWIIASADNVFMSSVILPLDHCLPAFVLLNAETPRAR